MSNYYIEQRPWGEFEILSRFEVEGKGQDVCVKKITVKPNMRLSYQSHKQRSESWIVVEGEGKVVLKGIEKNVSEGDRVEIPVGTKHRIANSSPGRELIFIEVSTGHFDEADIERFEDDFGRAG